MNVYIVGLNQIYDIDIDKVSIQIQLECFLTILGHCRSSM